MSGLDALDGVVHGHASRGSATRRGARRLADVPAEVLRRLEAGEPSVNHVEQMAIDMPSLMSAAFPHLHEQADQLTLPRFLDRMRAGGRVLWEQFDRDAYDTARRSGSDTVRGWGAFAIPISGGSLADQLALALPFADDLHFAVREWSWLAVRSAVAKEPAQAVERVLPLTVASSPRLRRFASEVLRPRGVWSTHLPAFKESPEVALPVLENLVRDRDRYVQNSVGNWLNDAAKDRPRWVVDQCERWTQEFGGEVSYVCARARRSINTDRIVN